MKVSFLISQWPLAAHEFQMQSSDSVSADTSTANNGKQLRIRFAYFYEMPTRHTERGKDCRPTFIDVFSHCSFALQNLSVLTNRFDFQFHGNVMARRSAFVTWNLC